MKLSSRETILGWVTLAALLTGLGFWMGEPLYKKWKDSRVAMVKVNGNIEGFQQYIDRQPLIMEELNEIRKDMPTYPLDLDVTSQLLRNLQRTADEHSLLLKRQEPEPEESVRDIYEVAINCAWQGTLDALVHFLYALQTQGAMVDIQSLTIAPSVSDKGQLKGNFVVDYAYIRSNQVKPKPVSVTPPADEKKAPEPNATNTVNKAAPTDIAKDKP